ncbi:hypothetical protein GGX14DRAFT_389134 [Mycena pura]|uniref:Uncharacterized protein n=1 Tax=Mycena pura TaxID=153505 RepID=A0AAD6YIZ8_9AGAR|nr:hypothetical protein GGX14DRAFT_389134 [Mycena pura]
MATTHTQEPLPVFGRVGLVLAIENLSPLDKFTILCSPPTNELQAKYKLQSTIMDAMSAQWKCMPVFFKEGLHRMKPLLIAQLVKNLHSTQQVRVIPSRTVKLRWNTICHEVEGIFWQRIAIRPLHPKRWLIPSLSCLGASSSSTQIYVTWIRNPGIKAQSTGTSNFQGFIAFGSTTSIDETERNIIIGLRYQQLRFRWEEAQGDPPMKGRGPGFRKDDTWGHFARLMISKTLQKTPKFQLGALAMKTYVEEDGSLLFQCPNARQSDVIILDWLNSFRAATPLCRDCRAVAYDYSASGLYDFSLYLLGKDQKGPLQPPGRRLLSNGLFNGRLPNNATSIPYPERKIDHPMLVLQYVGSDFGSVNGHRLRATVSSQGGKISLSISDLTITVNDYFFKKKTVQSVVVNGQEIPRLRGWFRGSPGREIADYPGFTWTERQGEYILSQIIRVDDPLPAVKPTWVATVKATASPPSIHIRQEFATPELAIRLAAGILTRIRELEKMPASITSIQATDSFDHSLKVALSRASANSGTTPPAPSAAEAAVLHGAAAAAENAASALLSRTGKRARTDDDPEDSAKRHHPGIVMPHCPTRSGLRYTHLRPIRARCLRPTRHCCARARRVSRPTSSTLFFLPRVPPGGPPCVRVDLIFGPMDWEGKCYAPQPHYERARAQHHAHRPLHVASWR